jgi:quercetin dioxygenase-like cupin family protein
MRFLLLACLLLPSLPQADSEAYSRSVKATVLLRTQQTSSGAPLSLPQHSGEVTGLEVVIPAGTSTGWHTHAHSGFAYVVSGTLRVTLSDSTHKIYTPGQAFSEVVRLPHEGTALGKEDVRLIAFFLTDSGKPVSSKLPVPH